MDPLLLAEALRLVSPVTPKHSPYGAWFGDALYATDGSALARYALTVPPLRGFLLFPDLAQLVAHLSKQSEVTLTQEGHILKVGPFECPLQPGNPPVVPVLEEARFRVVLPVDDWVLRLQSLTPDPKLTQIGFAFPEKDFLTYQEGEDRWSGLTDIVAEVTPKQNYRAWLDRKYLLSALRAFQRAKASHVSLEQSSPYKPFFLKAKDCPLEYMIAPIKTNREGFQKPFDGVSEE